MKGSLKLAAGPASVGLVLLTVLGGGLSNPEISGQDSPKQWEADIVRFEAIDKAEGIRTGQVLFLGSSSIRLWDIESSFPGLAGINRGFGGSQISDSLYYLDRVVFPYQPKTIVFYAGDNDVNAGESPSDVYADFKLFCERVHGRLPSTRIFFISIKPSLQRWALVDGMREVNRRVTLLAEESPFLEVVDIDTPMIGDDGKPRPELFAPDGLHLNAKGYELWSSILALRLGAP